MPPSSQGSVTRWIGALREGSDDAAKALWNRYFQSLLRVAAGKLRGSPRGAADEEDVALSVFHSVCRRAATGKLPNLADRTDLWRILVVLARQKSIDHRRTQQRKKRGHGRVIHASALNEDRSSQPAGHFDQFLETGPSPGDLVAIREELALLLQTLPHAALRAIAVGKLEGFTNDELAQRLAVTPRTVERKLQLIRSLWLTRLAAEDEA